MKVSFLVALSHSEGALEKLEKTFWEVSDPAGDKYQQFLSAAEIDRIVRTPRKELSKVTRWMAQEGVPEYSIATRSDSLLVVANVELVEKLFDTAMHIYVHSSGHTIIRNFGAYSVPMHLKDTVILTEGIADFPMHRGDSRRAPSSPQSAMVVPESLASLYKFQDVPAPKHAIQMPAEFQNDAAFSPSDLQVFFEGSGLPAQTDNHRVGPFNDQDPDVEATLDTQYMLAVGLGVTNWYWTSEGWMYTFANNLYNYEATPNVVSMSWGWAEDQQCTVDTDCNTLGVTSKEYVGRVNTEFMKLGVKGISIFASSGDSGANGRSDPTCTDSKLHAVFPASSPYVTAVGATMLETAEANLENPPPVCQSGQYAGTCASSGIEVVASYRQAGFTSGGGFSEYVETPAYQQAAVRSYLSSGADLPPASYFNAEGRGFPDVAAIGSNYLIYIESQGGWQPVGGTSASAPTWAGITSRLVDMALEMTGKPLGFMNPLLYKLHADAPGAFVDVTQGDNKCTEQGCSASCQGFEATTGWDPASGLGVPNYQELAKHVSAVLRDAEKRRAGNSSKGVDASLFV